VANHVFGVIRATLFGGALEQTRNDLVGVGVDEYDGIERFVLGRENSFEFGNLIGSTRVPVKQEAVVGIRLSQAIGHDGIRDVVGHVLARIQNRLDLDAKLGLVRNVGTKNVTR
jgi:hypothetical protein